MNTSVLALPRRHQILHWSRVRGLFAGTGFLLSVTIVFNLLWTLEFLVYHASRSGLAESLHRAASFSWLNALCSLPPVPLIAVILNLAPVAGWRRSAHFAVALALLMFWCWWLLPEGPFSRSWPGGAIDHVRWLANELESSVLAALLLWAFSYYRIASRVSDALVRAKIDAAALDTQLQHARLHLLRSQIEPHFLFNTLANVRTLARIERIAAVQLIDNLMRYLAAALPKLRQEECALEDEMELIRAYLGIYGIRMGARLSYEVTLPPELAAAQIPTMILLTLVENALKHGVNPAVEGGFVRVSAAHERSTLVLRVADSGNGMKVEHGLGSGLSNVRMRLMMRFGDEATVSLSRSEPHGVVAVIRIPMRANL
jgi:two-component sensor histidine kinase